MQNAFSNLELKFEKINRELEYKNAELEKVIEEKEAVRNYLQNILESLATGVIVTDLNGKITILNRCAGLFLGIVPKRAIGGSLAAVFPEMNEADLRPASASPVLSSAEKVIVCGRLIELYAVPLTGKAASEEGMIYILRDVTRITKLEEMEKRTEKFEALSELSANIAHEIRNPLGSIELFASLLMKESREKKSLDRLAQIVSAVKNVDSKITNLLLFTRKQNPLLKRINVHRILKEVLLFSHDIIEKGGISLSVSYAERAPYINGDAEMLKQAFLNILLNALQAMPDGGALKIKTTAVESGIEITFADRGGGIAEENIPKIFNPFFSTRARGSGLGLAVVHTIIDIHEGVVQARNTDKGALFSISLPLIRKKAPGRVNRFRSGLVSQSEQVMMPRNKEQYR